ncbi:hypothetical protein GCM10011415_24140 [Salipiger pallidus]|uniref:HTH merR-type domain-containing protein n=2 Tax=Salipiger pallidus TaxID=1775170 RepID=A0A8J2ZKN5_9RHOB|nr:hypothetical protein GCM10011415_24140 [Salipiger pallidus]
MIAPATPTERYQTISKVAEQLQYPPHILRFWESKFPFLTPVQRAGGRRYYRREDIALLQVVAYLLHEKGPTLKAVQSRYKDLGKRNFLR